MGTVKLLKHKATELPEAEYVTVTPQMAQEWLDEHVAPNRNLVYRRIEQYASMMQRGDWLITSQGIAFDEFGKLIDGQHRLHAIVRAQKPVVLMVATNVAHKAQLIMDQGQKRTPHDQIKLREGVEVLPVHVATAKAMIGSVGGPGHQERARIMTDIQLVDRFYMKHHKAIEFAVAGYVGHSAIRGVTIAPLFAPVARAYYNAPQYQLKRFVEVTATGESVSQEELPAVVLRNYLIAGRDKGLSARKGKDRFHVYRRTEVALKAFLEGRKIERLGQMTTEAEMFPLPEERKK